MPLLTANWMMIIIKKGISSVMMSYILVFILMKRAIAEKGFVNDVQLNAKYVCSEAAKEIFTVKSGVQCNHRCLRRRCNLLNYNTKEGKRDNCEVFTDNGECYTVFDQEDWNAMAVEVNYL